MARTPVDHKLVLKSVPVNYAGGDTTEGEAEGNNAAWPCKCGRRLIGRCYYQFGDTCYTECDHCQRRYRVDGDAKKKAVSVTEEVALNFGRRESDRP